MDKESYTKNDWHLDYRKMWLLGVIMSTALSFFSNKWGPLLKIKNEVEEVDKVAEEIEGDLPEGRKLREAVEAVDEVAKTTAKDAELVDDVINKVEEVEKDVDSFMDISPYGKSNKNTKAQIKRLKAQTK